MPFFATAHFRPIRPAATRPVPFETNDACCILLQPDDLHDSKTIQLFFFYALFIPSRTTKAAHTRLGQSRLHTLLKNLLKALETVALERHCSPYPVPCISLIFLSGQLGCLLLYRTGALHTYQVFALVRVSHPSRPAALSLATTLSPFFFFQYYCWASNFKQITQLKPCRLRPRALPAPASRRPFARPNSRSVHRRLFFLLKLTHLGLHYLVEELQGQTKASQQPCRPRQTTFPYQKAVLGRP